MSNSSFARNTSIIFAPWQSVPRIARPMIRGTPLWKPPKIRRLRKCILFTQRSGVPRMTGIEVRGALPSRSEYVQYVLSPRQAPALHQRHRLSSRHWRAFPESFVQLFGEHHCKPHAAFLHAALWRSPNDRHRRSGNAPSSIGYRPSQL